MHITLNFINNKDDLAHIWQTYQVYVVIGIWKHDNITDKPSIIQSDRINSNDCKYCT